MSFFLSFLFSADMNLFDFKLTDENDGVINWTLAS